MKPITTEINLDPGEIKKATWMKIVIEDMNEIFMFLG